MSDEQTDLYKVSASSVAPPGSSSGNPAAAASATGGDMYIFACTAQNQGPNSTYSGENAVESVCKERAQKTRAQNRRNAIAIRCNGRELWQFGADSSNQEGR